MFSPSRSLLLPSLRPPSTSPCRARESSRALRLSFSAISLPVRKEKTKDTSMRSRRSRRCFHCNGVPGPSLPLPSQPAFLRDLLLSSLSKRPNFCLGVRAVKGRDYVANGSDHPPRSNRKTARAGFCTFFCTREYENSTGANHREHLSHAYLSRRPMVRKGRNFSLAFSFARSRTTKMSDNGARN